MKKSTSLEHSMSGQNAPSESQQRADNTYQSNNRIKQRLKSGKPVNIYLKSKQLMLNNGGKKAMEIDRNASQTEISNRMKRT